MNHQGGTVFAICVYDDTKKNQRTKKKQERNYD